MLTTNVDSRHRHSRQRLYYVTDDNNVLGNRSVGDLITALLPCSAAHLETMEIAVCNATFQMQHPLRAAGSCLAQAEGSIPESLRQHNVLGLASEDIRGRADISAVGAVVPGLSPFTGSSVSAAAVLGCSSSCLQ